jgi:hypothetical protein
MARTERLVVDLTERSQIRGSRFGLLGLRGLGGGGFGLCGLQAMVPRHFLEGLQFFVGAAPGALQGIDDPPEALKDDGIGSEGIAGSAGDGCVEVFYQKGGASGLPEPVRGPEGF